MPTTSLTIDQAAAQIVRTEYSWSWPEPMGTAASLTYGFRLTAPAVGSSHNEQATFAQSTAAQKASFALALSLFSDVANITFTAVNPAGYTDDATMLFGNYTLAGDSAAGFAQFPLSPDTSGPSDEGDVWINLAYESAATQPLGSYDLTTIIHEVGHALGLEHPGQYNAAAGVTITYEANAEYIEDSRQYSLMSYFEEYKTGARHDSEATGFEAQFASTPLLHDIAAIQLLYGANMTTRTGDTVYGFNSTAGRDVFDFALNPNPVIAIWDAGGAHDVLDVSGYQTTQVVDLHQGAFSSLGTLTLNVAIAKGSIIEDAIGGSGADSLTGNEVANTLNGGAGGDLLYGFEGNDVLLGGAGTDYLDGGTGSDTLSGGDGNDTYIVGSAGDTLIETNAAAATGGTDLVMSGFTITLGANIENLTLTGTATINGTGNATNNVITGNAAANVLNGLGGNDWLNGGAGNDTMTGGDGNDTYYVNTALDAVSETNALAAGGIDKVVSSVTRALGANFENLTLTGSAALTGTGNTLANAIDGNTGANVLSGLGGNDKIFGSDGNDVILGGLGNDVLQGGGGNDTFVFNTAPSTTANRDALWDFFAIYDTIKIENAVYTGLGTATGVLSAAKYWASTTGRAHDDDDRIILNSTNGALMYDADGTGAKAGVVFATLNYWSDLRAADFVVI